MNGEIFKKTAFPNAEEAICKRFPDNGRTIFNEAVFIFAKELKTMDNRNSKVIGKHISQNILPGYAIYKALVQSGESSNTAIEFVQNELSNKVQRMSNFCKKLGTKKHSYFFVRLVIKLAVKFAYPKKGWTCQMIEDSKQCMRFDMLTCLYVEELENRNAKELCPAFCHTDVVAYSPLAPSVLFLREKTLAQSKEKCDFCFRRGK